MHAKFQMFIAPVTPFDAAGDVVLQQIPDLAELLRSRGADGFYLCGGTGEGMLLPVRTRMKIVEAWRQAAGDAFPLFVHVGAVAVEDACELSRHAAELGSDAISSIAPPVYHARDVRQLVRAFAEIAETVPHTPFYFYHNSAAAGPKFSGHEFLKAGHEVIPSLAGIKFTHEDLMDLSQCLRFADGRYRVFYGKDEHLLGACAIGATDFIGGSFNVVGPLVKQTLREFAAGNMTGAQAAYHQLVDVIAVLRRFGGLSAVKATMTMLGVACGGVRSPLVSVPAIDQPRLFDELRHVWPGISEPDGASHAGHTPSKRVIASAIA